jgi:DsbC/DsbD-like thiol-disulfide interchange protein
MSAAAIRSSRVLSATIGLSVLMLIAPMRLCLAADASPWDGDSRSTTRLIAANTLSEGSARFLRAGIEIKLATGWKTYWRYPGDSGVPPRFDFAASENVKSVTVRWPAPRQFNDAEGKTIGYKDRLVLPLRVEVQNPDMPVALRLKLDYAVCEKLCVPVEAKAELALADASAATESDVSEAERLVPKVVALGASGTLAITAVRREAGPPARIIVDVAAPVGTQVELFAEGPAEDWALPLPEPVTGAAPGH